MVQFLSIFFFSWISSIFVGFSKVPFFCVTLCVNLVISSIGSSRFNCLGSSFSSRTGMSWLGGVISFSRYLVLWLVIPALTVGICRSVCISAFRCTHGCDFISDHEIVLGFPRSDFHDIRKY